MTNLVEANVSQNSLLGTTAGINANHMAVNMLLDVRHVLVGAMMGTIVFCSSFLVGLFWFKINDLAEPLYGGILLAKMISLVALAAFGQSEALNFYLKHHSEANVSSVSQLNKIGIALTFICIFTLTLKLLMLKNSALSESITNTSGGFESMLSLMTHHSEALAFLPIIYFALIDGLVWWHVEERREIGRVCFVIADLPLLMPIAIIFILTVVFKQYGTPQFQLLIGGATSMFILVSIFLTQCTRGLLYGLSP